MKTFHALNGNSQRLDGGAMFGNAPKAMWERFTKADDLNRIPLMCRALLICEENRRILLETGIGNFFEPKLKDRYGVVESDHVLLQSLAALNLSHEDIDIVILSHLHFDHAGGLLTPWIENKESELLFPNAKYLVGKRAWERAMHPHARDRASFIPRLNMLLEQSNRLELIDTPQCDLLGEDYCFHFSDGHTPGMMLTEVKTSTGPLVFAADLIPGTAWVHLPLTMGYDRAAELVIDEKEKLLKDLVKRNGQLFYTHDPVTAFSHIHQNEQGRFEAIDCQSQFEP